MAVRYLTLVSDELLPEVRHGALFVSAGLRLIEELGARPNGMTLVEFEDDGAPEELEGRRVVPVLQAEYGESGDPVSLSVVNRILEFE